MDENANSPEKPAGTPEKPAGLRVGVVGVGYVGLTTGACLAHLGHEVVCADIDEGRIERLRRGEIPIVEEGLAEVVAEGLASGRLRFELGTAAAAERTDVVFLCVPTPQGADGGADLRYIERAAAQIAPVLEPGALVVNKSTVPVGSTRAVEDVLKRPDVAVVSNPEFLREGTAVADFLNPDRVVIGADSREAGERLAEIYAALDARIIITDPASAETIKYAANGFLAMKISFVNAIAAMCEAVGANVDDVVEGVGADERIGNAFFKPGPGWGGSCFPKDSRALVKIAADYGYDFTMMKGVIDVNDEQKRRMVAKVRRAVGAAPGRGLNGAVVGVLGLTFKAGTDDLRDSPSLTMVNSLLASGAKVRAFDPTVGTEPSGPKAEILAGIDLVPTIAEAAAGADVLVIATEWPEFAKADVAELAEAMTPNAVIVDTRNLLDPAVVRAAGLRYDGVGRP